MFQVFLMDFSYVVQWFQVFLSVFASVLDACFKCFICLQMLHLDVLQVDRVLHLPPYLLLPRLGVSSSSQCQLGI
jgi:hypothetical protein